METLRRSDRLILKSDMMSHLTEAQPPKEPTPCKTDHH